MEKYKVPIIVIAVLAVGAALFVIFKGNGGSAVGGPVSNVDKAVQDVTSGNRSGDPEVPEALRTGKTMGSR